MIRRNAPDFGSGQMSTIRDVPRWRGTSVQVCGLWPFAAGTGSPMVGVPLGRHLVTSATVCCDPISWFESANLISNPSMFVLGLPGLGKSTIVRRMCTGLEAFGTIPLILGDTKPDYVDLIRQLGGQVISVGAGRDVLNPLDVGDTYKAAAQLGGQVGSEIIAEARARQVHALMGLIQIVRHSYVTDREEAILDAALDILSDQIPDRQPTIRDVRDCIDSAPAAIEAVALSRGDETKYREITDGLVSSLGLLSSGVWGRIFNQQTTTPMCLDRPVVFDVSDLDRATPSVQGAVLLICWSYGFAQVNLAQELADAGIGQRRHYFIVMDELWRILRAGVGMVDRIDELTRLNRQRGVGQAMITHTMSDLEALARPEDVMKAKGFVERSGFIVCGGLPDSELDKLVQVVPLSHAERQLLVGWKDPASWDAETGEFAPPPGRGNFLIKVGGRPGLPINLQLTNAEIALNDTNKRWSNSTSSELELHEGSVNG